jgi:hypothetical protein
VVLVDTHTLTPTTISSSASDVHIPGLAPLV